MDDVATASIELDALKILARSSSDSTVGCVCCRRFYSKKRGFNGWESSSNERNSESIRTKARRGGGDRQKVPTMKSKGQKQRPMKQRDTGYKGYFCHYKSKQQHIENYRKEFSTVREAPSEEDSSLMKMQTSEKAIDPYIQDKSDERYLYKRLNLLRTLSDIYTIGVSPRDFRRQACLPPVTMSDTKARMKAITKIDAKEMESNVSDLSTYLSSCHVIDSSVSATTELTRERSSMINDERGTPKNEDIETLTHTARYVSSYHSCKGLSVNPDLPPPNDLHKSQVSDVRRPSQKVIDGLSSSLKEQLSVLRSGLDLNRNNCPNYPFHINNDRFMQIKPNQVKNDIRVKEKTVSSIPKAQKGKKLYISILGRNPLNKPLHES